MKIIKKIGNYLIEITLGNRIIGWRCDNHKPPIGLRIKTKDLNKLPKKTLEELLYDNAIEAINLFTDYKEVA